MSEQNYNTNTPKLYNPKSNTPAIYIPDWLSQISIKIISLGAKIVYGRLAQWSNEAGDVYRSIPQLAQEIGASTRSVKLYLKELKLHKLIGSFQPQNGGVNHYKFYDHPWIHESIKKELTYKETNKKSYPQEDPTLVQNPTLPRAESYPTPRAESCPTLGQNLAPINKKEIKSKLKTNNKEPVSVFLNSCSVKNHIQDRAKSNHQTLESDLVSQIAYYIGDTLEPIEVKKKTNVALKLIREKKWLIPHGWNGITTQSIAEKERKYEKQKKQQQQQDAKMFRSIQGAVLSKTGAKSLNQIFKSLSII